MIALPTNGKVPDSDSILFHAINKENDRAKEKPILCAAKIQEHEEAKLREQFNSLIIRNWQTLPDAVPLLYSPVGDDVIIERGVLAGLIGQAKVGKTTFLVGLIKHNIQINPNLNVLWVDTEQTSEDIKLMYQYGFAAAGVTDNITFLPLRKHDSETKLKLLAYAIQFNEYDICVLDNITDLNPAAVMDRDSASDIVGLMMQVTEEKKISILAVIHSNEGSKADKTKGFGHLGSEYARKCHIIIQLEKQGDTDLKDVRMLQERRKPVKPFAFKRTPDSYIEFITDDFASLSEKQRIQRLVLSTEFRTMLQNSWADGMNQQRTIDVLRSVANELTENTYSQNIIKTVLLPELVKSNVLNEVGARNKRIFEINITA